MLDSGGEVIYNTTYCSAAFAAPCRPAESRQFLKNHSPLLVCRRQKRGEHILAEKELVVSAAGLKALEDELEELKTVKRREVAEKIKVARGFGDLSENSEYD